MTDAALEASAASAPRTPSSISGAILAGGTSQRLGRDKRLLPVDGVPLLARTAATLRPLVDDLRVIVADAADTALVRSTVGDDVEVDVDAGSGIGPAAGLEVALAGARHDHVVVVATDHPALAAEVLTLLITRAHASDADAIALEGRYGGEPFLAVYRRRALPAVRAAIADGERRMRTVLATLRPELLAEAAWRAADPRGRTLVDVDAPADLALGDDGGDTLS